MRRSASSVIAVLALAAALCVAQPTPAQAGVVSGTLHVLEGVGGTILSVGKTLVCKGLSAAGTVAEGAGVAAGATAAGAASDGAGTAEGAAAGGAVGGVVKKGVGVIQKVICSGSSSSGAASTLAKAAVGAVGIAATFDLAAKWMIAAAEKVTGAIVSMITNTSSPDLRAAWFQKSFAPMAGLGAALALLVSLIAFASAAVRRDPSALAATLVGIFRAGLGTGLLIALTMLALQVTDAISADVIGTSHQTFWSQVTHAWGSSGFGGFGSSALAMLMAVVQIFTGLVVWVELAVRNAAIYLAVLFFPVALAASVWPSLSGWTSRLAHLLFLFVILKPVTLIVLAFAGNAALAGLTLNGGLAPAAGTIIAAVAIFALAAMAPWALMLIVGADAESAAIAAGFRAAAGHAVSDGAARASRLGGRLSGSGRTRSGGYRPSGRRSGGGRGLGPSRPGGSRGPQGPRPSGGQGGSAGNAVGRSVPNGPGPAGPAPAGAPVAEVMSQVTSPARSVPADGIRPESPAAQGAVAVAAGIGDTARSLKPAPPARSGTQSPGAAGQSGGEVKAPAPGPQVRPPLRPARPLLRVVSEVGPAGGS